MYQQFDYKDKNFMDVTLAKKVAKLLREAIEKNGQASLAVSGGSTPKAFFTALSKQTVAWQQVTITLVDERWVPIDSDDSNTKMVHQYLLQNNAKQAVFFHLKQQGDLDEKTLEQMNVLAKEQLASFDVLILGMGDDGHTASLFPCAEQINVALAPPCINIPENDNETDDVPVLMAVTPSTAPHQRITFTFAHLSKSKNIFLQICGQNKKQVLTQALADTDIYQMPIRSFLQHPEINIKIYWAES